MVDDGENGIMVVGLGQTDDEIHGYLLEGQHGQVGRDLIHRWASAMGDDFILLAHCASLDIL